MAYEQKHPVRASIVQGQARLVKKPNLVHLVVSLRKCPYFTCFSRGNCNEHLSYLPASNLFHRHLQTCTNTCKNLRILIGIPGNFRHNRCFLWVCLILLVSMELSMLGWLGIGLQYFQFIFQLMSNISPSAFNGCPILASPAYILNNLRV